MTLGIYKFPQVPGGGIRRLGSRGHVPAGQQSLASKGHETCPLA